MPTLWILLLLLVCEFATTDKIPNNIIIPLRWKVQNSEMPWTNAILQRVELQANLQKRGRLLPREVQLRPHQHQGYWEMSFERKGVQHWWTTEGRRQKPMRHRLHLQKTTICVSRIEKFNRQILTITIYSATIRLLIFSAGFTCAVVDCPEHLGAIGRRPGCFLRHSADLCCAEKEICREFKRYFTGGKKTLKIVAIDSKYIYFFSMTNTAEPGKKLERATCEVDGKTYMDGEPFTPKNEPTKTCYCRPGYKGKLNMKKKKHMEYFNNQFIFFSAIK